MARGGTAWCAHRGSAVELRGRSVAVVCVVSMANRAPPVFSTADTTTIFLRANCAVDDGLGALVVIHIGENHFREFVGEGNNVHLTSASVWKNLSDDIEVDNFIWAGGDERPKRYSSCPVERFALVSGLAARKVGSDLCEHARPEE